MKNKILYTLLGVMVALNIGLIVFVGTADKCECENIGTGGNVGVTDEEKLKEGYMVLNDKIIEYLKEVYDPSKIDMDSLEPTTYVVTLREFKEKGYDVSMFINPVSMKECNLDESYGRFIIIGTNEDGTPDYTYSTNLDCGE